MKFCDTCGSFLNTDWTNHHYTCIKCGPTEKITENIIYKNHNAGPSKIVVIGNKEKKLNTLSQTNIYCPKCENTRAYWWMVQTRSLDESSTQFYRCTKCGYTWREYS